MELRHLRYVIAAAENGSFRRAAAVLGVQESSVSRRIRDLEDEMGVALFNRSSSGVQLTQAGERFLVRARRAIGQLDHASADLATFGRRESGTVKIGILSSLASGFLCNLLRVYSKTNGNVHIDFMEGAASQHLAAVRNLQLDVAFVTSKPNGNDCDHKRLWYEQIFVAMQEGDRLAGNRSYS